MTGRRRILILLGVATLAGAVVAAVATLLAPPSVAIDDDTDDPAIWGRRFPLQYQSYLRTVDQVRTRHGGSEAVPRTPTEADPRSIVAQSRLEDDPRLVTMWAGYPFAVDDREDRGHAYMLDDSTFTGRQAAAPQPGYCLHCHASIYVAYRQAAGGDLVAGFDALGAMTYAEARVLVAHPIACIDCHDPATMALRVTRPAFLEGMRALRMSQGIADYDVNRDATRQELRSFVCGQCHAEYYFKGPGKRLTYPWGNGLTIESIYGYYAGLDHADWTHARTGARVLKAQHPEFELYSQGIHARAGVACADCHMPAVGAGETRVSDHQVQSPVLGGLRGCRTCHRFSEDELRVQVDRIQDRTFALRDRALDALTALIADLEAARAAGRTDADLAGARALHREAQFYVDFIEAENSMGFHAPDEAARILGRAIELADRGRHALASLAAGAE